jgi:hypothetical protein
MSAQTSKQLAFSVARAGRVAVGVRSLTCNWTDAESIGQFLNRTIIVW